MDTGLTLEAVLAVTAAVTLILLDPETEGEAETLPAALTVPHPVED